ncbi:PREDICTED: uncharacterized protein LOC104742489 [Camelina sativa]|uniref:Uncharacterized protein LOC104742489 n=1 Tax=Camelina sativa TaxID=90675 RepID=A0ABM0VVT0_CAMSA|nr:PREDICTED: uncharacterized protein LOC104742489 [Camelina sativa]
MSLSNESPVPTDENVSAETVPTNPTSLLHVNMTNVTKLTTTNYLMWSRQVHALFDGYDLAAYLDGSKQYPDATINVNGVSSPNPAFAHCQRQDKLLYNALLGAISVSVQPLLSRANSAAEIWSTLASTYAKPSRGHIRQIKLQLKQWKKANKPIDVYVQGLTTRFDELALLGKSLDHEDQVEIILEGLPDEYKSIVDQVEGRDTPPTLTELHEKLINHESKLLSTQPLLPTPVSANPAVHQRTTNHGNRFNKPNQRNTNWTPSPRHSHDSRSPRPYLGRCQICGITGHSARRCPQLSMPQLPPASPTPWQPRAHFTTANPAAANPWVFDSGATHHISSDLANLSLHQPYTGGEQVVIGDGKGLSITHTGEGSEYGDPVAPRTN